MLGLGIGASALPLFGPISASHLCVGVCRGNLRRAWFITIGSQLGGFKEADEVFSAPATARSRAKALCQLARSNRLVEADEILDFATGYMKAKTNFLISIQFSVPLGLSGISGLLFPGQRSIIVHGPAQVKWLSDPYPVDFLPFFVFRRRAPCRSLQGPYAFTC